MKLKKLAQLVALMGVVGPVMAQEAAPAMQRVEVTGSSIKRVAKEGALPVQVITFDQIEKQGITTTEQLVRTLSANGTGADNMTQAITCLAPMRTGSAVAPRSPRCAAWDRRAPWCS